jgi:Arc/MetJ-type ribon-helix-helix transcriptional regulator
VSEQYPISEALTQYYIDLEILASLPRQISSLNGLISDKHGEEVLIVAHYEDMKSQGIASYEGDVGRGGGTVSDPTGAAFAQIELEQQRGINAVRQGIRDLQQVKNDKQQRLNELTVKCEPIAAAIAKQDEDHRDIIELFHRDNVSAEDIAARKCTCKNTVYNNLKKSYKDIALFIDGYETQGAFFLSPALARKMLLKPWARYGRRVVSNCTSGQFFQA